jgi:hypothetical protein
MAAPVRPITRCARHSEKWITQRMTGQETRNKQTDYWATHNILW